MPRAGTPLRRVVVTGLGAVTPLGIGAHHSFDRILKSHSGLTSTQSVKLPANIRASAWNDLPSKVAGVVPRRAPSRKESHVDSQEWCVDDYLDKAESRSMATFTRYAVGASMLAMADARWDPQSLTDQQRDMAGVCLGSGIGNLEEMYASAVEYDKGGYKKIHPLFVPRLLINLAAGHISMRYGLQGPNHAVSTACTTGAHAIGDAARFIQCGDADVMLAGGSESCIHPLALAGFARSRSLSTNFNDHPTQASRPFDQRRDGFVIGEGAGVMLLEEYEHAKNRGADIYAELSGYGCSADAHHMTAPREDGSGALRAMKKALRQAGVRPREVDYINAHATSTPLGDRAEVRAITALMLGEEGKTRAGDVSVSSTKGAIGHLLGAAGAVEAIFTVLAMKLKTLPPTLNLEHPDSDFDLNLIPNKAQYRDVRVALSNSFGFGGTNASLLFKSVQ